MKCPKCGAGYHDVRVTDSRPGDGYGVRRRRECSACGYKFTTYEITATDKAKYELTRRQNEEMRNQIKRIMERMEIA